MDIRSFLLNAEVSVLVYDAEVAARMRAVQDQCLTHCRELTLAEWDQRPLRVKVMQNIARLVDAVLIFRPRKRRRWRRHACGSASAYSISTSPAVCRRRW